MNGQKAESWFSVKEVGNNVWQIDDNKAANIFLIVGNDSALVIDTGMGSADLASLIRKLTGKPIIVVNTHGHPDHTGANFQFEKVYIHPADMGTAAGYNTPEQRASDAKSMLSGQAPPDKEIYKGKPFNTILIPVTEGYIFNLGGRRIKVMETTGHTPGEICPLDIENRLLFTGDNNNTLGWLFLQNCKPLHEYLVTLEKQKTRISEFATMFPGHGDPEPSDFIDDQIKCVKGILNKSLERKPYRSFAGNSMVSTAGRSSVAFNPDNL